jgi:hypothetical protein
MRIIALAAVALLLTGCVQAGPAAKPPTPSSTPLFATEADALKAATEAYAAYLKVSDQITADGGADPERIAPYVTATQLKRDLKTYSTYEARGYFSRGTSKFDTAVVENYSDAGDVAVYLCSDFSEIRLVNADGQDITSPDLAARTPMEISFTAGASKKQDLLMSRSEQWSGTDFCS